MADLITEKELCKWLNINSSTAWRWRKEDMPYYGKKKSVRYVKSEVEKWLKERSEK